VTGRTATWLLVMLFVGSLQDGWCDEGEGIVTVDEVRVNLDEGTFEFEAEVVLREGVLELVACARGTKEHESIFAVDVLGRYLHAAALLLGAEPGRAVDFQGDREPPTGTPVTFEVEFKEGDQTRRLGVHELVRNVVTGKPMEQNRWAFVGSSEVATRRGPRYLAELTGALVVTYNDPSAVFDNPSPYGWDDTVYEANTELIPPIGTPVTLIGRVMNEEDKKDEDKKHEGTAENEEGP